MAKHSFMCTHTCARTHMHTHTHAHTHTHTHAHTHTHIHTQRIYIHTKNQLKHTQTHTYTHAHAHAHTCMPHLCANTSICMHVYTQALRHRGMHIQAHTQDYNKPCFKCCSQSITKGFAYIQL